MYLFICGRQRPVFRIVTQIRLDCFHIQLNNVFSEKAIRLFSRSTFLTLIFIWVTLMNYQAHPLALFVIIVIFQEVFIWVLRAVEVFVLGTPNICILKVSLAIGGQWYNDVLKGVVHCAVQMQLELPVRVIIIVIVRMKDLNSKIKVRSFQKHRWSIIKWCLLINAYVGVSLIREK